MKKLFVNDQPILDDDGNALQAESVEQHHDQIIGRDKHGNTVFAMQGVNAKITIKDGNKIVKPDVPVDSEKTINSLNKKIARLETKLGDLAEELESLLAKEA